ncbi:hypothetical protein ACQEU5_23800 [Marinactinospora thermotolerans]|uniref:hypothetical protein n=1 Tax=Marinactinospora thermotolerans TaxID=531310 RepID=UPI001186A7F6|nr:hypothetical protein [Marinactinospora thermotolerans]
MALSLLLVAGCAGPVRTDAGYREKANQSALHLLSAARTGVALADIARKGDAFTPYLETSVGDVEDDALAVRSSFATLQPPTPVSDPLRARVDALAEHTTHGLAHLRIGVRRGDMDAVARARAALLLTGDRLDRVVEGTR